MTTSGNPPEAIGDGTIAGFTTALAELRTRASGQLSLRDLATRAHLGKSTVHDALTRKDRLPSEDVVRAIVKVLDPAHIEDWVKARDDLSRSPLTGLAQRPPDPVEVVTPITDITLAPPSPVRDPSHDQRSRWPMAALVATSITIAGGAGFALGRHTAPEADLQARPVSPSTPLASDGSDPVRAGCASDAQAVTTKTVEKVGTLKLIYSTKCNAFWAKLE